MFIKASDLPPKGINAALVQFFTDFRENMFDVFKTITADNGFEFADLSRM